MLRLGSIALGDVPRIAVPLDDHELRNQADEARRYADVFELRIDLFRDRAVDRVAALCREVGASGVPFIATVRAAEEGGAAGLSAADRRDLYAAALPAAAALDVELRSVLRAEIVAAAGAAGALRIISHHDFAATPSDTELDALVDAARGAGADIVKIAAHAASPSDRNRLLDLLRRRRAEPLIVIAMGPAGVASRVFFPLCGSLLTYGFLNQPVAPGQLSIRQLREALDLYGP
jgi:3-dehydroquinate dehydratase-1